MWLVMEITTFTPDTTQGGSLTQHLGEGRCCASVGLTLAQTAELCRGLCNGDEIPQPKIT